VKSIKTVEWQQRGGPQKQHSRWRGHCAGNDRMWSASSASRKL